jgi:hypothetical protein
MMECMMVLIKKKYDEEWRWCDDDEREEKYQLLIKYLVFFSYRIFYNILNS